MRRARRTVRTASLMRRHDDNGALSGRVAAALVLLLGLTVGLTLVPPMDAGTGRGPAVIAAQHESARLAAAVHSDDEQDDLCPAMCPVTCSDVACSILGGSTKIEPASSAPQPVSGWYPNERELLIAPAPVGGRRPPVSRNELSISRT